MALIVQTFDPTTIGANAYLNGVATLARMDVIGPKFFNGFISLDVDEKDDVIIAGTLAIEIEAIPFLRGSSQTNVDRELQTLAWSRVNAFDHSGAPIVDQVLESWTDAIIWYLEPLAQQHLTGKLAREAASLKGVVEDEIDPQGAKFSRRWVTEGAPSEFFDAWPHIWRRIRESLPGSCR